ncbi:DUF1427 family protein [bacterium 3DAC]|nr:DUF1427 family protein [Dictyoglomota bacterium]UZN23754.1 DUF1427 family protein [bacterium 3DAC]
MGSVKDNLMALGTGFAVGAIFALLKLEVPAPTVLPGIMGILGIFLGYIVVKALFHA